MENESSGDLPLASKGVCGLKELASVQEVIVCICIVRGVFSAVQVRIELVRRALLGKYTPIGRIFVEPSLHIQIPVYV